MSGLGMPGGEKAAPIQIHFDMFYEEYRHRREGAGARTFFLVRYWFNDGISVREFTKGVPDEKWFQWSLYKVRGVSPSTPEKDENEISWEWDDKIHREPISRSRACLPNKKELRRADQTIDERQQELREVPEETPAARRLRSDLRFLKGVRAEYLLWFTRHGFEVPTEDPPDRDTLTGHSYARELYDYLDLEENAPSDPNYTTLSTLHEHVQGDRPVVFTLSYNGLNKALKKAGFYPTEDEALGQNNSEKLVELFGRIKEYVEDGTRPG